MRFISFVACIGLAGLVFLSPLSPIPAGRPESNRPDLLASRDATSPSVQAPSSTSGEHAEAASWAELLFSDDSRQGDNHAIAAVNQKEASRTRTGSRLADSEISSAEFLLGEGHGHRTVFTSVRQPLRPGGGAGVPLDAEGQLRGTLGVIDLEEQEFVGAETVHLYFLKDDEQIKATVDDTGRFQANLSEDGEYAMIAAGREGILALNVDVTQGGLQARGTRGQTFLVRLQDPLSIRAALVAKNNLAPLSTILMDEGRDQIREAFLTPPHPNLSPTIPSPDDTAPRVSTDDYEIALRRFDDGTFGLRGYTDRFRAETSLVAYFLQDGTEIAAVDVEADGTFEARSLPDGVLSLVVVGSRGLAAFSLRARYPDALPVAREVSFAQGVEGEEGAEGDVDIEIPRIDERYFDELARIIKRHVPLDDLPALRDALGLGGEGAPSTTATSGVGPGRGSGGGGGAGGAPGGGALAAALLAAGVAAASQSDRTPILATPFRPALSQVPQPIPMPDPFPQQPGP